MWPWRRNRPLTAAQTTDAPTRHDDAPRLTAPRGKVVWVCSSPTGRVGCAHDTEAQAKWHGKDVFWPEVVDDEGQEIGEAS